MQLNHDHLGETSSTEKTCFKILSELGQFY